MRLLTGFALVSLFSLSACRIGRSGKDLAVAAQPAGAQVIVVSRGSRSTGELIALQRTGIVVLSHNQLRFFPFPLLDQLVVSELGSGYRLRPNQGISQAKLERVRLVSHFPQGLTPEIQRRLLEQLSQSAVDTAR